MEKINIKGSNDFLVKDILSNGLRIYLVPNKNVKNFYMTFSTKFGSINTCFKTEGETKYHTVPNGLAHFLEHITFKMENNIDASDLFADLGSSSNAFTSFDITSYEVFGYNKFKENLTTLLDFVQTPFYTKEIVESEKGIIIEEVKSDLDSPDSNLFYEMYKNVFKNDNRKNMICGTVEDVKSINLNHIMDAYNTFYHPSNMFLVITGNFNYEEALAIIEENQSKKKFKEKKKIINKKVSDVNNVVVRNKRIKGNVEIEKVSYGVKLPISSFKSLNISMEELRIYLSILTDILFGRTSLAKDSLISGNIITDGIYIDRTYTSTHVLLSFISETPYPKKYLEIITNTLKNIKVDKSDFERKRRVAISNFITCFDDIEAVNSLIQNDIINFDEFNTDLYDLYNKLDFNILEKIIKKINLKNTSEVILEKKD